MNSKSKALGKMSHLEKYEPYRKKLIEKDSSSKGALGISEKGVYRHNPATGFNERVHHKTGKFTGKSAY